MFAGGVGNEHRGGASIFQSGGQIVAQRTPHVKTTTQNLAELIAVTRALRWASQYALAMGRPICIRYRFPYAIMIASGAWKAKKHRAAAADARAAWVAARKASGARLWIKHNTQRNVRFTPALQRAQAGQQGQHYYAVQGD